MEILQLKESLFTNKSNQAYRNKPPAWGTDDSNGNSLSYKDLLQEFKNQQNSSAQQEQQKNNQSANPQSALVSQKSAQEMLGALSVFSNTRNIVSQANLGASNSQESQNSNARSASITITDTPSARSQFKATGGKSSFVLKGDANGDGKVDKADCELMVKKHFGKNVSIDMDAADFDGDGRISAADLCDLHYIIETNQKTPTGITGDINNDGEVDIFDATKLVNYLKGKDDASNIYNEDVDGNGVVDENDVNAISNLIEYGKVQKPNGITGDINNDGEVDIFDVTKLAGYLNGKEDATRVYNEDVDGNGVVDKNDVNAISNLIEHGKLQKPNNITGDINNDGEVDLFDAMKLDNYLKGNEDITQVYNEDVDGNGVVDENDVKSVKNLIQYGSIHEPQPVVPMPPPAPSPDTISTEKAGWKANALDETQVFTEQDLKTTTGEYECVFKHERVTIVAESNNAYKIKYWSDVEGKDKERWIDKTALTEPTPPQVVNTINPNLDVIFFSQKDPDWAGEVISTKTIGNVGCYITALAMKYSYQTGQYTNPSQMKNMLSFTGNNVNISSVEHLGYHRVSQNGQALNNSMMQTIYENLCQGIPVIVGGAKYDGSTHFILVKGYIGNNTNSFNASDFVINDPQNGRHSTLAEYIKMFPKINSIVY